MIWLAEITVDASLNGLHKLTQLEELTLCGPGLNDGNVAEIARLSKLKSLELKDASLTDLGLQELAALPAIETISISGGTFSLVGVERFLEHTKATKFEITPCEVTESQYQRIQKLHPHIQLGFGESTDISADPDGPFGK